TDDAPWHAAKREIALAIGELTLLPAVNVERRAAAHAAKLKRWNDSRVSASTLGITSPTFAARCDAVLAANRAYEPMVLPDRITRPDPAWRPPTTVEFFCRFAPATN